MGSQSISTDLIRGHTDTIILNVLRQDECYGYELYKLIPVLSDGQYELKEPTLYAALHRLEAEDCVVSYWGDESQGGRRKYYKITAKGLRLYEQLTSEWRLAKEILTKLIEGGLNDDVAHQHGQSS